MTAPTIEDYLDFLPRCENQPIKTSKDQKYFMEFLKRYKLSPAQTKYFTKFQEEDDLPPERKYVLYVLHSLYNAPDTVLRSVAWILKDEQREYAPAIEELEMMAACCMQTLSDLYDAGIDIST